jgi:CheY-like chemotaxis protein
MTEAAPYAGLKVLVVEDEMLIAMLLEDMLTDLGCEIVGPVSNVEDALARLEQGGIDAAILDVNLGRGQSYPVAEVLRARGLPFAFATGYGEAGVDARFKDAPALQKPFRQDALERALASMRATVG